MLVSMEQRRTGGVSLPYCIFFHARPLFHRFLTNFARFSIKLANFNRLHTSQTRERISFFGLLTIIRIRTILVIAAGTAKVQQTHTHSPTAATETNVSISEHRE